MKKLGNLLLVLLGVTWVGIIVGYGVVNNFTFDPLLESLISLFTGTINHLTSLIDPLTLGLRLYIYGGLFILIRLLKQGRIFKALFGFLSPIFLAGLGITFVAPDYFTTGMAFYEYLLSEISVNLINVLYLGSLTIIPVLVFGIVTLQGLFTTRSRLAKTGKPKKVVVKKLNVKTSEVSIPASSQPLSQDPSITTSVPAASVLNSDLQLTDLVKLVLAEELSGGRPTYNSFMPAGVDANLVRRIVAEELAKFQSHFITRAEAQALVAQELAALKAQLKIK
jgi:hypothetical protein